LTNLTREIVESLVIWKERNARAFGAHCSSVDEAFVRFIDEAKCWRDAGLLAITKIIPEPY
jgi:hypothetical protein